MAGETITLVDVASNSSSSISSIILMGTLVIIVISALGWFMLNQQSASISNKSMAMAAGTSVSTMLSSKKRNLVAITGPMGGGKTALWCYLRFPNKNSVPRTQTSMSVNSALVHVDGVQAHLVDIPGHQKYGFDRDTHLSAARAILFVVDSAGIVQNIRSTAEALYEVLANEHVQQSEVPVMIVCNKQDDPSAVSNSRIKSMLEGEIDKLRVSRQAGLDSLRGSAMGSGAAAAGGDADDDAAAADRATDYLGFDGKKFCFEDLPNDVQINEASMAMGLGVGGLEPIKAWIAESLSA
ncbi:hypothetical protein LPJ66_005023 [Kickxella alabastrina]|uniref:Uncharacterized protein n=1 Tax=Kickxella alabastrina TaxID=61397 RepID=A0ACC1IFF2_9FUNG|nr:hypothetical protein LPJ66_005023 [Kickxella alabastrina]